MENDLFFENSEKKRKAIGLIHRVYLTHLKNSRKYLASTKTRSEVRGGGRKPWRQKGTGRARAGSTSSPLWDGGGVIFGPKPRTVEKKINKKERNLAILSAFYLKKDRIILVENDTLNSFKEIKTKKVIEFLNNLKVKKSKKILFILTENNRSFWLACRNIPDIEITTAKSLNLLSILRADYLILPSLSYQIITSKNGSK